ncbi:MAG: NADH-quinone oxidoreductase subunit J [archaeon]
MWEVLEIVLLATTCMLAVLTAELKDLLYAIIALAVMSISLGALFWLLNAPYVALFQILICSGATTVLLIVAVMLTRKEVRTTKNRRRDWMSVAGTSLAIVLIIFILTMVFTTAFPIFSATMFLQRFVESFGNVGQSVSRLLWGERPLDLIAQAFLVLASAASCSALLKLRSKKEEK